MNISIACGIKKHNIRLMFNGHSYNNAQNIRNSESRWLV